MTTRELEQWLRLVEGQLEAARRLDGARLQQLTERRALLQGRIDMSAFKKMSAEDRRRAQLILKRIQSLDRRIRACGSAVLAVLDSLLPPVAPVTYGRRGQLREG